MGNENNSGMTHRFCLNASVVLSAFRVLNKGGVHFGLRPRCSLRNRTSRRTSAKIPPLQNTLFLIYLLAQRICTARCEGIAALL
jgi:hypothetical protein